MVLRKKESIAVAEALYHELNRIYFKNELPEKPKISFRKYTKPDIDGKYYQAKQIIGISANYILTDEDNAQKYKDIAKSLRHQMLHFYEDIQGKKVGHYKRFNDRLEVIENYQIDLNAITKVEAPKPPEGLLATG